ncbi:MAG: response regulator [Candidatus Aminicenantes bacterium]|nr:response regulator [Candidatus Aminicenantes bacterium]NIM79891.1 response regulator [Candidatus Aminicenantes bacterium]NIN19228.1 response regulator [Candidatus Aminicenantes bacterium]NIN43133.1 response regulator [Candidatus Aminicenantes bacterium]NIN85870.1 response regulator [Candidatus Aminicenantes bacterium]
MLHLNVNQVLCFLTVMLSFWGFTFPESQKGYNINPGFKYFRNYSTQDRDLQPSNWCVLQDRRGIIYVGNLGGLLEYDGVSRRYIKIPNRTVRSMAMDEEGTLYIGGNGEIGFLTPNSKGMLQYVSLMEHLSSDKRNFSKVWRTHYTKEGIYFWTSKLIFRWNSRQKKMRVWEAEPNCLFNRSFVCGGKFFVQQRPWGLMQMVNDSLQLIPGGEVFSKDKIYMLVPYDSETLLIGTISKGFWLYAGSQRRPFPTEVEDYLIKNKVYRGIRLSSSPGDFALASRLGGLVIMDSHGHLKYIFNQSSGLQNNNVRDVFEDNRGNLWLALSKGVSRLEYASPFFFYDKRSGLQGLVSSITRHQQDLYAGTDSGLYGLTSQTKKFHLVPGMSGHCWSLLSLDDSLLAATSDGVFHLENNGSSKRELAAGISFVLCRSQQDPDRIWVGTAYGLVSLYRKSRQSQRHWDNEHKFENITQEIRTIVEEESGNLWLGTLTKGVLYVDFTANGLHPAITATPYDKSHGLPPEEIHVFMAAGHVMFATRKGVFRFDKTKKRFIPDLTLGDQFAGGDKARSVFRIAEDKQKNIWIHSLSENFHAIPKTDGTFMIKREPFNRIPDTQVNTIYPDPGGNVIWFASNDGLICYDKTFKKNYRQEFSTFIRRAVVNGKEEIFNGYKIDKDIQPKSKPSFPIIPYKERNLRFEFAAPFFENESATTYRFLLEGYDENWSDWTSETRKDYTNLNAGIHRFRVQAKNVYGHVSREDVFLFKVLPPWYQTWWAYSLYVVGFLLIIYFTVRWRSRKLELEKQRLEKIIKERTKEIEEKNIQLEEQSEQLKEMDKVKSRFFANISHEFRTPLTLIMGPLEQMLSTSRSKQQIKQINLMIRNSQRLLTLINQLLDLSKLDSGKIKLQAHPQQIVSFLKGVLASFELASTQNKIDLKFHAESEDITLYFDPGKLEDVICNLLINAFKFTPAGGEITVTVKVTEGPAAGPNFPSGSVDISVRDTGIGVPQDQLEHIFERFYQAKGPDERGSKGSGIGLALARELVSLHHGEIHVTSKLGDNSGTEFIIRLPLGKAHLKPEDIVEDAVPSEPEPAKPGKTPEPSRLDIEKEIEVKTEEEGDVGVEGEEKIEKEIEKNLILVVEDNAEMRDYIRGALEPQYSVVEAADGREGIDKAKEIIPDLIVSDIMMPEVDGYELCRVLKKDVNTSHVPVVLLTAKASEDSVIQGLETGADDYITKPFNTTILKARIKNLIDLRLQLQLKIQRQMVLQPAEISVSSIDQEFIKELQDIIDKNLSEPEFNVEEMCKKLYMSRATLYRKVMALTGESPIEFIRSYRLKRAAQLLKANFGNVTEVAFEVGFSSTPYFTKCFKEKFHRLPSSYQASEAASS